MQKQRFLAGPGLKIMMIEILAEDLVGMVSSGTDQVRRSVQGQDTVSYDLGLLIPDIGTMGKVGYIGAGPPFLLMSAQFYGHF